MVDENEDVVNYALRRRPNVKLVSTGLVFGKEGFTKYVKLLTVSHQTQRRPLNKGPGWDNPRMAGTVNAASTRR